MARVLAGFEGCSDLGFSVDNGPLENVTGTGPGQTSPLPITGLSHSGCHILAVSHSPRADPLLSNWLALT